MSMFIGGFTLILLEYGGRSVFGMGLDTMGKK